MQYWARGSRGQLEVLARQPHMLWLYIRAVVIDSTDGELDTATIACDK